MRGTFALLKPYTKLPPSSAPRNVLPSSVQQAPMNHIHHPLAAQLPHRCLQTLDVREK